MDGNRNAPDMLALRTRGLVANSADDDDDDDDDDDGNSNEVFGVGAKPSLPLLLLLVVVAAGAAVAASACRPTRLLPEPIAGVLTMSDRRRAPDRVASPKWPDRAGNPPVSSPSVPSRPPPPLTSALPLLLPLLPPLLLLAKWGKTMLGLGLACEALGLLPTLSSIDILRVRASIYYLRRDKRATHTSGRGKCSEILIRRS